jgi:carboxymethylenebutenolidase
MDRFYQFHAVVAMVGNATPATALAMTISIERIEHGERLSSLVRPTLVGDAGVLLLPSVHGVDRYALDYAHLLAEARLACLVWEPFPRQPVPRTREERAARLATLTDATSLLEMLWWLEFILRELPLRVIGAAGFCLGGRYALLLAAHDARIAACLPYYPTIETPSLPGQHEDVVELAASIRCPVHMVRAGNDHLTSEAVFKQLQQNLQSRSAPTVVQLYPEGEHGFEHGFMQRTGAANETAIRLSTAQSLSFLKAALMY